MGYTASHLFEAADGGDYCGFPDANSGSGICCQGSEHPVHAVDRPDIEALARALSAHRWRTTPDALAPGSEHRRHIYTYECAVCTNDLHRLADFFLTYSPAT